MEHCEGALETIEAIEADVVACNRCARLVEWRNEAAAHPPPAHARARYWARPLAGFGDVRARLLLVGLAPAAHGGNRTGRMFTGDRSGDFLFAALHRTGFANQATSISLDDGLVLSDAFVSAAVRCAPPANRPNPDERRNCAPYLGREIRALTSLRVVVALGALAYETLLREPRLGPRPARVPRFAHGAELVLEPEGRAPITLISSYHPSQRNVFTGLLRAEMLDAVLTRAGAIARAAR